MVPFSCFGKTMVGIVCCFVFEILSQRSIAIEPVNVGRFMQEFALHRERQLGLPSTEVRVVFEYGNRIFAETQRGFAVWDESRWSSSEPPKRDSGPAIPDGVHPNQIAHDGGNRWVAAAQEGLFEYIPENRTWQKLRVADGLGRLWADSDVRGATYDAAGRLWFACLAGVGVRGDDGAWRFFEGKDGLPFNDFTCVAPSPDGSVWFGTRRGAIQYDGQRWAYRQGLRWLPNDEVRSIVVDAHNTVWVGTAHGVGCIVMKNLNLKEKAIHYESQIDQHLKRTKYGYVATARLGQPGDLSEVANIESDNDGLWTAMYGASQCYAFAVTKSDVAKKRATDAFRALSFLQQVTQGTDHSPPKGYVARTILPTDGADPNRGRLEHDRRFRETRDRMWKVYEPRWPRSADGKWYWKSDTSSDELDGHYFFYALYYDLVVETEEERNNVRQVVKDLTDHLIDHDFVLQDHDGTPTRWGVFRPSSLNHDFRWYLERGLNSLSMLSYLAVAHHVTQDSRYEQVARNLRQKHAYATNAMVPKIQRGIGSGNQSDDEMAFMSFYNLIRYTDDPSLLDRYITSFYSYWRLEEPERNPFFHFAYAAVGLGAKVPNAYGERDLSPKGDWLEDSIAALKRFPLDRFNWSHTNHHRLDLVDLPTQQSYGLFGQEPARRTRGYRVDGKVLPVDERFFSHWNTDPWRLDDGGDGRTLASGTVFLLPYYMGRYHGLIE